jgi:hypothetical protein
VGGVPAILARSHRRRRRRVTARGRPPRSGGELGKADMHLHTLYSDGTASVAELLEHVERHTDLDVIAITDHERIDGALRARDIHESAGYSFDLVVGEEITTRRGHVLALFLTERVPALRPLPETLERIHDQGGLAIAAHPMAPLTPSVGRRSLLAGHADPDPRHRFDAIEIMNPSAAACGCPPSATRTPTCSRGSRRRGPGFPARAPRSIATRSRRAPREPMARSGAPVTTSTSTGGS